MKPFAKLIVATAVVTAALGLSPSLRAQWPKFSDKNVPRTPDGKVNLDAPTPRTADGKPDLSGVWEIGPCPDCPARGRGRGGAGRGGDGRGRGNAPLAVPDGGRRGAEGTGELPPGGGNPFGNIGIGTQGGAPYQQWAADLVKKRMADNSKDNPDAHCLPMGIAQLNAHPYPRKIIQTPAEV